VVTQSAVTPQAGRARKLARPQHMPGYVPTANAWPTAATVDAALGTASKVAAVGGRAGTSSLTALAGTPVSIGPAAPSANGAKPDAAASSPVKVTVTVASHAASTAAGASGVVVRVARADGGTSAATAKIVLSYSGFIDAFGGNFADRLALVSLPACALTTPKVASCRKQTPVKFVNDRVHHTLTATITVPGAAAPSAKSSGAKATAAAPAVVMAATSGTTGMNGSYTATPLKASDTWVNGGNSGSFTYSYPITVPPALGGAAPKVALSYDSGSIDGRTSVSNAQGSWVGDGWDYNPGSISRTFQPCTATGYTGDECWGATPGITLQMPGLSGTLVKDDSSGIWRVEGDTGARVQLLTGAPNGMPGDDDQYWRITTTDGTQYFFGAVQLPTSVGGSGKDTPTYSAWGVPVFGTGSPNSACTDPSTAVATNCRASWQWNLDFVVDPNGNVTRYSYAREENYYLRGASASPIEYQRGGFLTEIDYGWQAADVASGGGTPAATVAFTADERCISDRGQAGYASACPAGAVGVSGGIASSTGITSTDASAFVDTPLDQACNSAGKSITTGNACPDYWPSFFVSERLAQITTDVWTGSGYRPVDQYTLPQQFNTVPDPSTAGNQPTLWLAGIQHSGWVLNAGSTTATKTDDPEVYTHGSYLPNRAQTASNANTYAVSAYNRLRMDAITTVTGSEIDVAYALGNSNSLSCSTSTAPTITANNTLCYPEYWTVPGSSSPTLDWFNKYVVTTVTVNDDTQLAPGRSTNYTYIGTPAWHTNDSEQTLAAYRTFDQFRGFKQVQAIVGVAAAGSNTKTLTTYFQGMDQDGNATYPDQDANKDVWVNDNHGDVFPGDAGKPGLRDDNALAGFAVDVQTFASDTSNTVESDVVSIPADPKTTVTAAHARASGLPAQRAHFVQIAEKVTYQQVSTSATPRRSEIDYQYDDSLPSFTGSGGVGGNGRLILTDDKGDGTVQELCTFTGYAINTAGGVDGVQWTGYPDEVITSTVPSGSTCATNNPESASTLVSDTTTLYDNQAYPGVGKAAAIGSAGGNPTSVQQKPTAGSAAITTSSTSYDQYGRVLSSTDADQHTTATEYTPHTGYLPTAVKTTNPATWTSTVALDQGRSLPETSNDVNGRVTTEVYDGLGHLTAVWEPTRPQAANPSSPNIKFTYVLTGTGAHPATAVPNAYVETQTLREDGSYGVSYAVIDGFGDTVQTQATPANDATGSEVSGTVYDSLGRAIQTYTNVHTSPAPSGSPQPLLPSQLVANTVTTYDGMSRPLTATVFNGANAVPGDVTTTAYPGLDRTDVTQPAGNGTASAGATSTFTDVRGRTTALWTYHNNPPSPDGNPADADVTRYSFGYVSNGTQSTVTDAAGESSASPTVGKNTWTTTTGDLLGHSSTIVDPDTGTSKTLEDNDGNVIQTVSGNGATLSYYYDVLGRKTAEYNAPYVSGSTPAASTKLASWAYDTVPDSDGKPTLGMAANSIRYTGNGANQYVEAVTGYNTAGKPTSSLVTIPPNVDGNGALAGTYRTNNYYTPLTDLLDHTDLPAAGALPAETVYNSYNNNGLLLATGGNADYVTDTQYDTNGNLLTRTVGDYPYQVVEQNAYDPATNRVTRTLINATAGQDTQPGYTNTLNTYSVDAVSYTYDAAGRITSADDVQNGSVSGSYTPGATANDNQCYTYDYASRLTNAWADAQGQTPSSIANGGLGSCADSTSNNAPTSATALGGPAPYWQTYGFDNVNTSGLGNGSQTGNRSTLTDHATTTGGADTTSTSAYPTAGSTNTASTPGVGPHLLSGVTETGGTTGSSSYTYDAAGNMLTRTPVGGGKESVTWDPEGRLLTDNVAANGSTPATMASYLYDANGNELIRRDAGGANVGTTLYLDGTELHLDSGGASVHGTRYYNYPGAPEIISSSTGALTYEITNNQGTGDTTLNAANDQITARRYNTPFGTPRAATASTTFGTFPDDHTFLGKSADTSTGLVDVGARKYDPATGSFISADPVFQPTNPQAIGGYAYAGNDPVNNSDPAGTQYKTDPNGRTYSVNLTTPPPPPSPCAGLQGYAKRECLSGNDDSDSTDTGTSASTSPKPGQRGFIGPFVPKPGQHGFVGPVSFYEQVEADLMSTTCSDRSPSGYYCSGVNGFATSASAIAGWASNFSPDAYATALQGDGLDAVTNATSILELQNRSPGFARWARENAGRLGALNSALAGAGWGASFLSNYESDRQSGDSKAQSALTAGAQASADTAIGYYTVGGATLTGCELLPGWGCVGGFAAGTAGAFFGSNAANAAIQTSVQNTVSLPKQYSNSLGDWIGSFSLFHVF
jgi:RHS repeat-associated protein